MAHASDVRRAADSARRILGSAQRALPDLFRGDSGSKKARTLEPIPLRVDDEESYVRFVTDRTVSSAAHSDLARAVESLRRAFEEHTSDGHGAPYRLDEITGEIERVCGVISAGDFDGKVPLSVPPNARGNVRCWQDAGHVCCSIRLRGRDGAPKIATTCSPISRHIDDVVGYVVDSGVDEIEALSYVPDMTLTLGGGEIFRRLELAAPAVLGCTRFPCFGVLHPDGSVEMR
jgi:hypothetical protein